MLKKKLSTPEFREKVAEHMTRQPKVPAGANAVVRSQGMTERHAKAQALLGEVATTLREIAETHPDAKQREEAKAALEAIEQARITFKETLDLQSQVVETDS